MFSPGQILDDRYEIVALLAEGGMGAVYRARRTLLGDEVAIKIVRGEHTGRGPRDRFFRESRASARLRHPNIVSILDFNAADQVDSVFEKQGKDIAAVIVEPVAGNMNLVLPAPGFLETLRDRCTRHGAVLILDEVMTGFRVALGGAQARFGIRPDLTTLGKVIGGGLPVGAVGGRRDIMERIAPLGPVYQAGTLSGNPVAVAAGLATLKLVQDRKLFESIEATTTSLVSGLQQEARAADVAFSAQSIGSMFGIYFRTSPPASFAQVMQADKERFNRFFHEMLKRGVYLAPSAYEAGFVSAAHGGAEIEETLAAARAAFAIVR